MTHPPHLWRSPPKSLNLRTDEVHVWRAALNRAAPQVQEFQRALSRDERERAERFHFRVDREHFIVSRGLLRTVLGRYLNAEPGELCFCYSPYGKPSLAGEFSRSLIKFNLSHSRGVALFAFTRGREIGVDVEFARPDLATDEIAERFFSPREVTMLRALPKAEWREAFFKCWTRKESYIKAVGKGLSLALDQFDVSLAPGEPAALLSTTYDPEEASRWRLEELQPGDGYEAALAAEGQDWSLQCCQWPE